MAQRERSIENLIQRLHRQLGIGPKTAERLAFHLLRIDAEEVLQLAKAIEQVRASVETCSRCIQLDARDPCSVCSHRAQDQRMLLVLEDPREVQRFEDAGYRGFYHVPQGRVSQLERIRPEDLTTGPLLARVAKDGVSRSLDHRRLRSDWCTCALSGSAGAPR